jgi:hypothetical protein
MCWLLPKLCGLFAAVLQVFCFQSGASGTAVPAAAPTEQPSAAGQQVQPDAAAAAGASSSSSAAAASGQQVRAIECFLLYVPSLQTLS